MRDLQILEVPRDDIVAALTDDRARTDVLFAEPDSEVHARITPHGPDVESFWEPADDGQTINGVGGLPGADIVARRAWGRWNCDFRCLGIVRLE